MNKPRELKLDYEKIKIEGRFRIMLGDEVVSEGKNKWIRYLPSSFVQVVAGGLTPEVGSRNNVRCFSSGVTARAGSDTSTPTTPNMTDLASKLDYEPNNISRVLERSFGYQSYTNRTKFIWNPGTIPESIIGEFGVYLTLSDDSWESPIEDPTPWYQSYEQNSIWFTWTPDLRLAMRVSSADGDFSPISYSSLEPLSLEWYVTIKF